MASKNQNQTTKKPHHRTKQKDGATTCETAAPPEPLRAASKAVGKLPQVPARAGASARHDAPRAGVAGEPARLPVAAAAGPGRLSPAAPGQPGPAPGEQRTRRLRAGGTVRPMTSLGGGAERRSNPTPSESSVTCQRRDVTAARLLPARSPALPAPEEPCRRGDVGASFFPRQAAEEVRARLPRPSSAGIRPDPAARSPPPPALALPRLCSAPPSPAGAAGPLRCGVGCELRPGAAGPGVTGGGGRVWGRAGCRARRR